MKHVLHIFGFGHGWMDNNKPEVDDEFILDPRLGGELDDEATQAKEILFNIRSNDTAESFKLFRELGKKVRNGEITAYLARRFKTQRAEFMADIEAELDADIRAIWTPSETNCFKRLKGPQLDAIYAELLDLSEEAGALKSFMKLKKGQKNQDLHKLFHDADYQKAVGVTDDQLVRINAWVPDCF